VKNVSDKVVRPNYSCKKIGGERPLLPEIWVQSDHVGAKSPIFDLFSFVAPQP